MTISYITGAQASTDSVAQAVEKSLDKSVDENCPPPPANGATSKPMNGDRESVRHLVFGSLGAVRATIHHLHRLSYAEPNDWSPPISTNRSNEVMVILTKRIQLSE
ncbi:MAG: hypothetical protein WBC73_18785 [Phormidesmis sp.]